VIGPPAWGHHAEAVFGLPPNQVVAARTAGAITARNWWASRSGSPDDTGVFTLKLGSGAG
jgi:hypothetical protein